MGKDERAKDLVRDNDATDVKDAREKILAAIRRAAAELGRAPSRGELRRISGVSHYRVLAEFRTLREAVRAAGLEPNPKGEKISTEDLLADWKRVAEKLGRRPSRAEYVREGRYSAGALTVRFGSWSGIGNTYHGDTETRRTAKTGGRESFLSSAGRRTRIKMQLPESPKMPKNPNLKNAKAAIRASGAESAESSDKANRSRLREPGEFILRDFDRVPLAAVPTPLVGMRRVTEEVAQMVVNTLMGSGYWPLAIGSWPSIQPSALSTQSPQHAQNRRAPGTPIQPRANPFTTEVTEEHGGEDSRELTRNTQIRAGQLTPGSVNKKGDLGPSLAVNAPRVQDDGLMRRDLARRGIKKDRPVMGEPFDRSPMTNAPVNELGVMVLFGMVAAALGLQVESVQGKFPDCLAKRQVAPGKWPYLRIEFEYESKNFYLHGHDPKGCDMIVCWRHNWKECPAEIEVVELSRLLGI